MGRQQETLDELLFKVDTFVKDGNKREARNLIARIRREFDTQVTSGRRGTTVLCLTCDAGRHTADCAIHGHNLREHALAEAANQPGMVRI